MFAVSYQDRGIRSLLSVIRGRRQQICLSGPRGVGKRTAAIQAAKYILCHTKNDGCTCKSCRLFKISGHPDLLLFRGEDLGVGEVREKIVSRVQSYPLLGSFACVISGLEDLSEAASNGLLKTLEEPPHHTFFLLTTTDPSRVPPAILSRCSIIEFRLLPEHFLVEQLRILGSSDPDLYARMAEGSLGNAIVLWKKNHKVLRDTAVELLKMRSNGDVASVLGVISDVDKAHVPVLLLVLHQIVIDAMLPSPRIHKDVDLSFLDQGDMYVLHERLKELKTRVGSLTLSNALKALMVQPS